MFVFNFLISFLTAIAIFLFGMKIMSDGLERTAGTKMRSLFGKISNNRFVGLGVGTVVTAVIHSSAATTVMAISFVNAGLMTMIQAANIIMGANIGTTVTGLLIALSALDMALYMTIPAFIGVFMMLCFKNERVKKIGTILAGVGILFVGLNLMSEAVGMVSGTEEFKAIFNTVDNPFLLMLIGILVTALIQSSTAVNALIIVMAVPVGVAGGLDIVDGLYIILGTNVGTCITALIASIGTSTNAKRTSVFHLLFNVIGTVIFALVFVFFKKQDLANFMRMAFGESPQFQIAWFNFFQNLICALLILPFTKYVVRLTEILIKDKPVKKETNLVYIDQRFEKMSSIAVTPILQEVMRMAEIAKYSYVYAMDGLLSSSTEKKESLFANEKMIDNINIGISDYLVKLSGENLPEGDQKLIGTLFHVVSDIERIGDHNINIFEFTAELEEKNLIFSEAAINELKDMYTKILEMYVAAMKVFETRDASGLSAIDKMESEIDYLREKYSSNHIDRLSQGLCTVECGMIFYGILTDLERIADHLTNIAFSIRPRKMKNIKANSNTKEKAAPAI